MVIFFSITFGYIIFLLYYWLCHYLVISFFYIIIWLYFFFYNIWLYHFFVILFVVSLFCYIIHYNIIRWHNSRSPEGGGRCSPCRKVRRRCPPPGSGKPPPSLPPCSLLENDAKKTIESSGNRLENDRKKTIVSRNYSRIQGLNRLWLYG